MYMSKADKRSNHCSWPRHRGFRGCGPLTLHSKLCPCHLTFMCGPDYFKAMMSPWHIGEKFACVGTITNITHKPRQNQKKLSDDLLSDQSSWPMIWCHSLVRIPVVLVNMAWPWSQMRLWRGQRNWHEDKAWLQTRSWLLGVHFLWSLRWGLGPLRPGSSVVGLCPGMHRARVRPAHPWRWSLRLPALQEQTDFLRGLSIA